MRTSDKDGRLVIVRAWRVLVPCIATVIIISTLVFAASPVRVIVNGVDLGPAAQGQVIAGQVMVPLRAVAEALGADVKWDPAASCVYIMTKAATEAAKEVAPAPAEKQEVTVYITKSGSKYHRLGCRYLSKSCIPISLEDAKARGYTPCSVCGASELTLRASESEKETSAHNS